MHLAPIWENTSFLHITLPGTENIPSAPGNPWHGTGAVSSQHHPVICFLCSYSFSCTHGLQEKHLLAPHATFFI